MECFFIPLGFYDVGHSLVVTSFIGAVLTLLGNLLADVSYALVDPRIRVS